VRLSREALERLRTWRWPGNVRELANAVERGVILCRDDVVRVDDLPEALLAPPEREVPEGPPRETLAQAMEALERAWIAAALRRSGGVKTRAAAELGIDERVLRYKLSRLGMGAEPPPSEGA
jgi:DNA-binding NtrC family response regulator